MQNREKEILIDENVSILETLKYMDTVGRKLLIVTKEGAFSGLVSVGDMQRAIIKSINLSTPISKILRSKIKYAQKGDSIEFVKQMMLEYRMEICPELTTENELSNIYFWEDLFGKNQDIPVETFKLPVVIMAGGFGTRLKPLTYVIPKPLVPLTDKTMIEDIIERFVHFGSDQFIISINYKADLIKYYLSENLPDTDIEYIIEARPLGTAGSLGLLKGKLQETFFVTNCDIIIDADYSAILKFHKENNHDITIVAAVKNYHIPYGTIETDENGQLLRLQEKPDITFKINTGMYILEPETLNEIIDNEFLHITHLIEKIKDKGGNVGVFPVSEGSWKDMGDWNEYLTNIKVK